MQIKCKLIIEEIADRRNVTTAAVQQTGSEARGIW